MSILIKGMKMPTGNDELRLIIRSNGQVIISHETYYEETEAVPVPEPHGRLIDADALHNSIAANIIGSRCGEETSVEIAINETIIDDLMIIDAQPTVIPASEEGET